MISSKPASSVCFDSTKAARRSTTKAAENFLTTTTWVQSFRYLFIQPVKLFFHILTLISEFSRPYNEFQGHLIKCQLHVHVMNAEINETTAIYMRVD